jgi:hypothetical protein
MHHTCVEHTLPCVVTGTSDTIHPDCQFHAECCSCYPTVSLGLDSRCCLEYHRLVLPLLYRLLRAFFILLFSTLVNYVGTQTKLEIDTKFDQCNQTCYMRMFIQLATTK